MISDKIVGIDIGGTKISVGLITGDTIVKKHTVNTEARKSQIEISQNIFSAIEEVWDSGIKGIGVGVPGLVDNEKGIVYHLENIPSWQEVPLKEYIESKYRIPTFINNDANCFVVGEKYFGLGSKYKNFVGVTLGTGLGAGIIINNKLYSGLYSGAGEFSSVPFNDSIYEKQCSGKFFKNLHGISGQMAAKKAQEGDKEVLSLWHRYGENLGYFMHLIMYSIAPEAIIIGGSISNSYDFFKDLLNATIDKFPFAMVRNSFKVECTHNPNSAIMSAGALYFNAIFS